MPLREAVVPSPPAWGAAEPDPSPEALPPLSRWLGRRLLALGDRFWGKPHPLKGRDPESLRRAEGGEFRSTWEAYFRPEVDLEGRCVLDLGCGRGAQAAALGALGARFVVAVDRQVEMLETTRAALARSGTRGAVVLADAARLPFRDGAFGAVLCTDTVEHLHRLQGTMDEMDRVLAPAGAACVAFAPYASRQGGHLGNYTALPWCHLLVAHPILLERIRERTRELLADAGEEDEARELRHVEAWERFHFKHCLPKVTLGRFSAAVAASPALAVVRVARTGSWILRPLLYLPWWSDRFVRAQLAVLRKRRPAPSGAALLRRQACEDFRRACRGVLRHFSR